MNSQKLASITITVILVISVFVFVMLVSAGSYTEPAPGPAEGTNVTINETMSRSMLQPSIGVNFTIQFNTTKSN